jgi:CheY-like chemotaxis protein
MLEGALTWLIADDEADILNLVAMMCRLWGHQPLTFNSGDRVWDWLDQVERGEHHEALPELALLDIRMPGKKGNELAHRIRRMPALRHIPIVLMTAFSLSDSDVFEMAQNDGVDYIIYKPLPTPDELRQMLDRVIENKQANRGQMV